jgi:hypothetical protein
VLGKFIIVRGVDRYFHFIGSCQYLGMAALKIFARMVILKPGMFVLKYSGFCVDDNVY